ncbi:hypothetical protein Tco_1122992 [Tanacetum coccineum]|uniref:Uncharacterized protein n=1 Tax=Tanacetum coccineum TaxID=301880 RepID=A0ABQ5J228_9ASTR
MQAGGDARDQQKSYADLKVNHGIPSRSKVMLKSRLGKWSVRCGQTGEVEPLEKSDLLVKVRWKLQEGPEYTWSVSQFKEENINTSSPEHTSSSAAL